MFVNRTQAGARLAHLLRDEPLDDAIVLGVTRGGVPVGFEIAKSLDADFSIIIVQKLPLPSQPESGFGAVAEDGTRLVLPYAHRYLAPEQIEAIIHEREQEIERQKIIYRGRRPRQVVKDRTVIIADDGVAMGSTLRAAVRMIRKDEPARIILAAPVSSPEASHALEQMESVSRVVIPEKPQFFSSIKQAYEPWTEVTDHDVLAILKEWQKKYA